MLLVNLYTGTCLGSRKREVDTKKPVSGKKLKPFLKSSSTQIVGTQFKTLIKHDKGEFNEQKQQDKGVTLVPTKKGVKKKKRVLPTSSVVQNSPLQNIEDTKLHKKQKTNVCKSGLNKIGSKNKKSHTTLDRLTSFKTNFNFKGKHKFVVSKVNNSSRNSEQTNTSSWPTYYTINTSSDLLDVLPQPSKHTFTTEVGNAKANKRKKQKANLTNNVNIELEYKNNLVEEKGSVVGGKVGRQSQIQKATNRDKMKQSFISTSLQPQANVGPKVSTDNFKNLTRRNPGTLRERMLKRLQASRFRYLNQQMYCSQGEESFEYFKMDPSAFQAYHHGYRQQVSKWPLNPLTTIINSLKKKSSQLVIADFGCGDAQLARSLPNTVHSFDLVALTEGVTVCNMAHTPLSDCTVDVAVFCLSLMGTNLKDYLIEANRILKMGGIMKMAEVESRFEDVAAFIKTLMKFGFTIIHKDLSHNLFYFMDFQKVDNIKKKKKSPLPQISLKPCMYKKR